MQTVSDPARQTNNLDTSHIANLPIGVAREINEHEYIIAIDSAFFMSNYAYFNAYTSFDFPGTTQKVAFAAKHIKFNPKGVVGGASARLMLVSEHVINIGPNTQLYLPPDGNNYIEWDCNGFSAMHLKGIFKFSKGILLPDSALTSQEYVTAGFEVHTNDVYNIVAQVNVSPFRIKGFKDFGFTVDNAVVDLSDFANSPSMVFPAGYQNTYGESLSLWRGFYLKQLTVRLPSELQKSAGPTATITATNLLIDDAGISGLFAANNLMSASEGDMHGWGFSINTLAVELKANNVNSGLMRGEVEIPALDNGSFNYTASISKNMFTGKADYLFSLQPGTNYSMSCFFGDVTVYPTSCFTIQKKFGKFKPSVKLNGIMNIGTPDLKIASLGFQNLTIVTEAPYLTNGVFTLSPANSNHALGNFPISISSITAGIYNGVPTIGLNVSFNTNDDTPGNFSVATTARVISKVQASPITTYAVGTGEVQPVKTNWSFDKVKVNDIHIVVNTQPFSLDGIIAFRNDHPTYGKGFFGSIVMNFGDILPAPVTVTACFGKTSFRYWSLDAAVPINAPIPGTPLTITQVRGGLAYHMSGSKSNTQLITDIAGNAGGASSGQTFVPNESIGISFRAGAGFNLENQEKLLNGDAVLGVSFNSSGGLNNINFVGNAYMLVNRAQRAAAGNKVYGSVNILYDNVGKVFSFNMNANFDFAGSVSGMAYSKLYISQSKWYFWLGRPTATCYLNIQNLASVNAYLMVGQELEPMAPPPANLVSLFNDNNLSNQRDNAAIASGNGFAVGVNFSNAFDKSIGWDAFQIYGAGSVGAGFDMTMFKFANGTHCEGSTGDIGFKNWYLQGRLYAWLSVNAGIRGHALGSDFDITLLSANVALLLEGKLPKPTYVAGYVHLDATVLEFIHVNMDFDFEFGNNCTVVSG